MTNGTRGLLNSKRSVFVLALLACATALAFADKITGAAWIAFAQWIGTALVAGHTATSVVTAWKAPETLAHTERIARATANEPKPEAKIDAKPAATP